MQVQDSGDSIGQCEALQHAAMQSSCEYVVVESAIMRIFNFGGSPESRGRKDKLERWENVDEKVDRGSIGQAFLLIAAPPTI